jgi:mannosyl-oligosaccharide alpha-1,2-mannosidase
MVRLGDILTCASNTPSFDPVTRATGQGTTNTLAGAESLILQFARVSQITGTRTCAELAHKAEPHLLYPSPKENEPYLGLLGACVQVADGQFISAKGGWGLLSDSYYEYLIKTCVYDPKTYAPYLERWLVAADSTIRPVASKPFGRANEVFLPFWEYQRRFNAMDSLSWFSGGNFILGSMVAHKQTLVDFGLVIAINKVCKTDTGFSAINNVSATVYRWWPEAGQTTEILLAEMLKYMWLINVELSFQIW